MIRARLKAAVILVALGLGAAGCVTVFPKDKPIQLYRFGDRVAQPAGPEAPGAINVLSAPLVFDPAAEGDRILTVTGQEVAYIGDARWIAPASVLFDEAETRAFEASGGPARLVRRADVASTNYVLRLNVETFQAEYPLSGPHNPVVKVQVHGVLIRTADRKIVAEREFESRIPAEENRVGAIVRAYDTATAAVLQEVVSWTGSLGAG
jgi:cholesterol transport system auxiliary component